MYDQTGLNKINKADNSLIAHLEHVRKSISIRVIRHAIFNYTRRIQSSGMLQ